MDKINKYLDIAEHVARNSTCLRANCGSIIVKDDEVISYGYNEVPHGRSTCGELGYCIKEKLNIPQGEGYSKCRAICSEQNAIIRANPEELVDATLYLVGLDPKTNDYIIDPKPCCVCERFIINARIKEVYVRLNKKDYKLLEAKDFVDYDTSF